MILGGLFDHIMNIITLCLFLIVFFNDQVRDLRFPVCINLNLSEIGWKDVKLVLKMHYIYN